MKYSMMVVDDEAWIRERLIGTIDWESIDIGITGEAANGDEALKKARELEPDIILTDIRMPVINGLDFVKCLKEEGISSEVIIISGYSDFEYAKRSIQLGAFDYVLKPVDDSELTEIVSRCLHKIESKKKRDSLIDKANKQIKENFHVLKEKLFINLVNGNYKNNSEVRSELEYLGIKHEGMNHICFIVQLDEAEEVQRKEYWNQHLIQFAVCNITGDFMKKLGDGHLFFINPSEVVCVISDLSFRIRTSLEGFRNGLKQQVF